MEYLNPGIIIDEKESGNMHPDRMEDLINTLAPFLSADELGRIQQIRRGPYQGVGADLAGMIDHTLLASDATPDDIRLLCHQAETWHTYAVCINSWLVPYAHEVLSESSVKIASVAGFPLGAEASSVKAYEGRWALDHGAHEIDMVINLGALKAKNWRKVLEDIEAVKEVVPAPHVLKVILETVRLTDEEKVQAAFLSVAAGADFVKTSTGFDKGGATVFDVRLLREVVGTEVGVKAAGKIHTTREAQSMVEAGASRIGASRTREILGGLSMA